MISHGKRLKHDESSPGQHRADLVEQLGNFRDYGKLPQDKGALWILARTLQEIQGYALN